MSKQDRIDRYREKLEAKEERLRKRASRKLQAAAAAEKAVRQTMDIIPMGQPILVGHHSEKRHRRDLARMDRNAQKALEADRQAAALLRRADNVGGGGISSDDPEAIDKLREKLADLESKRERIKEANRVARAAGREPCEPYVLRNLGANIRRVKGRIAELERKAARGEAKAIEHEEFMIEESIDDNRIRFYFTTRPSRDICRLMRRNGFKWAPSVGAWQRHLNAQAVQIAKYLARKIFGVEV